MGNADLRQLAVIEEVAFDDLDGDVVAVDAHNWLYRYLTITVKFTNESVYTTEKGEEVANLIGIVQGLPKFFENDLTPIFVFDGSVTQLKADEIEQRRDVKADAEKKMAEAKAAGDAVEAARFESRTQRLTDTIHETSRTLLAHLDVPYVEAPAEGEAQAAHMARTDEAVDYAGSEDYDTLLLGAPKTLRKLTTRGAPELMDFNRTLAEHDITREQLVDVGILVGTDFNDGVTGYGPKTALDAIHEHGDLWAVLEAEGETIEHADEIRDLFLDPDVTDDYSVDLDPSPNLDAAKRYVTEEWEVPMGEVDRGFERIESALTQTGLDRWT
ncbi:flap endonuclease-1 [Halanaeroarchaeum sulfurireducens]|uniref:Flap endonuclease 1 n=1 Tax=Halanaeroarchaeum sulfurireducens TaxID=1604004 RepID=A0A0F7PBP1_9EURY|nr:flap endonuclease-1 [Halanaeroarchaeum sulfurireducens]AKH97575.1 flap endonuclease-1 [Halanaeroarchaeum sulfurireducens]ALG81971.1 flap endonuclease-1 [Halanaeroarchaeum sulfurireducens]